MPTRRLAFVWNKGERSEYGRLKWEVARVLVRLLVLVLVRLRGLHRLWLRASKPPKLYLAF